MRRISKWAAMTSLVAAMFLQPVATMADVTERTIGNRSYLLVDPSNVRGAAPLVLALHGGFGSAENFRSAVPMDKQASKLGFRVAYLNGTGAGLRGKRVRTWNAGRCCGPAQKNRADDINYINGVINQLSSQGLVSEIHMVGHSNGAMMTYRYLCEGGKFVSSAVIMSGSKMNSGCNLAGRTRVMVLHGEKDENVPIRGGSGKGVAGADFASLNSSVGALTSAGASVRQVLLPSAGHRVKELNRKISGGLGNYVTDFMFSR